MNCTISLSAQTESRWSEFTQENTLSEAVCRQADQLKSLWEQSPFCARLCQRYPHWLDQLIAPYECFDKHKISRSAQQLLVDLQDAQQLKRRLREFRHCALLRICWKDLILQADIADVLEELSALAEVCLQTAADWLYQDLIARHGAPCNPAGEKARLVVIALGKLGAEELNFSSDIDLMFCYSDGGATNAGRSISNQEFFTQLAQKLIAMLAEVTAEGFVYRVDCRLRPFGASGPLVVNFNYIEDYLHTHGREWERYAFIKARVIYGAEQDSRLFADIVSTFVYRKYIDFGVIDTLREMKNLISQQMTKKINANNIKLGGGGIREIEFIVQFFQLVHGGRKPGLQTRAMIDGLAEIAAGGYLAGYEADHLAAAYRFLRRLENRLQMRNDEQTHTLPDQPALLLTLAESMQFSTVEEFHQALNKHLTGVSAVFARLQARQRENPPASAYQPVCQLFTEPFSEPPAGGFLQTAPLEEFRDCRHVYKKLRQLAGSSACRNQDKQGRQRLLAFMPCFLHYLQQADSPALVMDRLAGFLQTILRRSAYLVFLYENQRVLKQLIDIAAVSPWIISHLTSYPLLLDDLPVSSDADYAPPKHVIEKQFADQVLAHIDLDYENILERVRLFKHARELRVACADVQNKIPVMKVSDQLSWTAEVVVGGCVTYLEKTFDGSMAGNLAVIAFGKLGGIELSYGSDLDLVYICRDEKQAACPAAAYRVKISRLAQRLTQMLTLQTVSGRLYDVDTRLRPDGRSGAIVPAFSFVQEYYQARAWTWELQALVRARCICASQSLARQFFALRKQILCMPRDNRRLAEQVSAMRARMLRAKTGKSARVFDIKNDSGGITDIEFMIQYAILAHAHKDHSVCEHSDNIRLLERLAGSGFISGNLAGEMAEIYCRFRQTMHYKALQSQPAVVAQGEYATERKAVRDGWNEVLGKY